MRLWRVLVDDILAASNSNDQFKRFEKELREVYTITSKGDITEILNIRVDYTPGHRLSFSQEKYLTEKARLFNVDRERTKANTPLPEGFRIISKDVLENVPYLEAVGALGYTAKTCRPDVAYGFSYLSRYSAKVSKAAWGGIKQTLQYLYSTKDAKLVYDCQDKSFELIGYCDASYANNDDGTSTSGRAIYLGTHLIHWKSNKQSVPATSTAAAEIYAASDCFKDLLYIQGLLNDLGYTTENITMHCDNNACIAVLSDEISNTKTRHLSAKIAFIRHYVKEEILNLPHVPSEENVSDIFTKALGLNKFRDFIPSLGLEGVLEQSS